VAEFVQVTPLEYTAYERTTTSDGVGATGDVSFRIFRDPGRAYAYRIGGGAVISGVHGRTWRFGRGGDFFRAGTHTGSAGGN